MARFDELLGALRDVTRREQRAGTEVRLNRRYELEQRVAPHVGNPQIDDENVHMLTADNRLRRLSREGRRDAKTRARERERQRLADRRLVVDEQYVCQLSRHGTTSVCESRAASRVSSSVLHRFSNAFGQQENKRFRFYVRAHRSRCVPREDAHVLRQLILRVVADFGRHFLDLPSRISQQRVGSEQSRRRHEKARGMDSRDLELPVQRAEDGSRG